MIPLHQSIYKYFFFSSQEVFIFKKVILKKEQQQNAGDKLSCKITKNVELILYLIEAPFDAFANRADPDQAALIRAA